MKIHRKVTLKSKTLNGQKIVHTLEEFAKQIRNWSHLKEKSLEYSADAGSPSCELLYNDGQFSAIFAFTVNDFGQCYLVTIIPKNTSEIPLSRHNSLLKEFSVSFGRFIKYNKLPLSVSLSQDHAELLDIIPGKVVRGYFERFLKLNPTSYHPNDIERLDLFICAASKHLRKQINVPNLQKYLIEDLHWSGRDAELCCDRIETGLDILKVYKKV
jgi:hypothetical protein